MTRPAIYIVSDGKPGHLAQSRGLADAIVRRRDADIIELASDAKFSELASRSGCGLVIGAGRQTYRRVLALSGLIGVPAIAMMNPGWWLRRRFDLCIIPRHDGIAQARNIIVTEGAINGLTRSTTSLPSQALLLIGGPSKHHRWDDGSIRVQLSALLDRDADRQWTATGSRRTPESTDRLLRDFAGQFGERFVYTPATQTPRGWVARQLERCGVCWVSEDSVSMVYEALTAGARVGLLTVPTRSRRHGRVVRGVRSLVEHGRVTAFDDWQKGKPLPVDQPALAEADRVAQAVLQRWPMLTTNPL